MTKTVRFGLIGCGGIGAVHAKAIELIDEAELVAVCDLDLARAHKLGFVKKLDRLRVNRADPAAPNQPKPYFLCHPVRISP